MYLIKNAIKNIGRNKGRNILLGVIVFAILFTSAVSIIINKTTEEIIKDYKTRFATEVYLNFDSDKWLADGSPQAGISLPTPQQYIDFSKSEQLKKAELTGYLLFSPDGFKLPDKGNGGAATGDFSDNSQISYAVQDMLVAENHVLTTDDFKTGIRKIVEGNEYLTLNECIISKTVADLNGLKVGDSIKIKDAMKADGQSVELKITGIFEDYSALKDDGLGSMLQGNKSDILTNFETAISCPWFETVGQVDATYFLKSPHHIDAFQRELQEKGLSKYYKASVDDAAYKRIVAPVEGLSKITRTFLFTVLILGSVILILLSTLAIRERKYEIGVLRAMGMKKGKVAISLLMELLVITAMCLVMGLGIGAAVSQPIANSLMKEQIKIAEENKNTDMGETIIIGSDKEEETLSEVSVHLSGEATLQISMIALFLIVLSSSGGILYITKFEPMKILSERG